MSGDLLLQLVLPFMVATALAVTRITGVSTAVGFQAIVAE